MDTKLNEIDDSFLSCCLYLNGLAEQIFENAKAKGWYKNTFSKTDVERLLAALALVHSEVSEAVEDVRNGCMELTFREKDQKPEGFPSELADIIIRVLDISAAYDIDIAEAVTLKMENNATRSHRHGDKLM